MAKNSIISSFRKGFGPAGLLALVLVAVADLLTGAYVPLEVVHAFNQNNYDRPGIQDYEALSVALDFPYPEALDVVILGSSRPRDGILPQPLADQLQTDASPRLNIVNYGKSGGRVYDFEVLVERLIDIPNIPKVVVLPINPRFTQSLAQRDNLRFTYMKPWQLGHEIQEHGLSAPLHITGVLLSNLFPNLTALRHAAREWVEGVLPDRFDPHRDNPIVGGLNKLQRLDLRLSEEGKAFQSIAERAPKAERIAKYVANEWPPGAQHSGTQELLALKRGISRLTQNGTKVLLMDLPMSNWLTEYFPPQRLPSYRKELRNLAQELDIVYVPARDFPSFTDADFREQSHMNRAGALKLTRFVGEQLKIHLAQTLRLAPLRPSQLPSLRPNESLDAGHGASQSDAGVTAP